MPEKLKAETVSVTADALPYINATRVPETGILTAVLSIAGGILWLRRKLSRDNKDISQDRVEVSFVVGMKKLLDERTAELALITEERNTLASEVGGLRAKVEYLEREQGHDRSRIRALERRLDIALDEE